MIKDELYRVFISPQDDLLIEIIDGEFFGTVIQLGDLIPQGEGIGADYHLVSKVDGVEYDSEMFISVMTTIISDIVNEAMAIHMEEEEKKNKEPDTPQLPFDDKE